MGTGASQHDHNCTATTTTRCWLKPDAAGPHTPNPKSTAGVVTASPARPVIPPPPPPPPHGPNSPHNISGYHIVIVGATKTLLVVKMQCLRPKRCPTVVFASTCGSTQCLRRLGLLATVQMQAEPLSSFLQDSRCLTLRHYQLGRCI